MDDALKQQQCQRSAFNIDRSPKRRFSDFDKKRFLSPAFSSVSDSAFLSSIYDKPLDSKHPHATSDPAQDSAQLAECDNVSQKGSQPQLDSDDAGAIVVCHEYFACNDIIVCNSA